MKKPAKITLFSIGGIGTVALVLTIVLGLNYFYNNFGKVMTDIFVWLDDTEVPQPEVKYGEFPFKLVYEINGYQTTIEETLVIEHVGIGYDFQKGSHNKWNTYFLNKENEANLAFKRDFVLLDNNDLTILFTLGCCEYYFGLEEEVYYTQHNIKAGDIVVIGETGKTNYSINDDDLYSKYGIKIVERWVSPPLSQAG